jgi:CRP-like cAMP-binding protein
MENLLLAKLPPAALEALRPYSERVSLNHGEHAIVPEEPIRHLYFPAGCLLSLVTQMADGSAAESGCIGREGMSGIPVLLDAGTTTMPTFCQVPGGAVRVRSDVFKEVYEQNRQVRQLLNRYVHTVVIVGSHATACNRLHTLEQRFCKWLLMSSDGVGSEEVALTQEYLAVMLGVRRAGVTEAAGKIQEAGIISYRRGHIQIKDHGGLERMACECYRRTKEEYERLFSAQETPAGRPLARGRQ